MENMLIYPNYSFSHPISQMQYADMPKFVYLICFTLHLGINAAPLNLKGQFH